MKRHSLLTLSSALITLLLACQGPVPQLPSSAVISQNRRDAGEIASLYPIAAGHSWTFELQQTQNDQDNSKFRTMTMFTEPLPPESGAERAVLRRAYPDSNVTPTPSLIKRFADRVELSRYQPASSPDLAAGRLSLVAPAGAQLPDVKRGVGFIIAMQLPFEPGHAWEGRVFQGGSETIAIKGYESVSVPAGNFRALLVEHHLRYDNGREDFLRYWYVPGIGMVKLYEELTAYFGQWLKFRSTGVLTQYSLPGR